MVYVSNLFPSCFPSDAMSCLSNPSGLKSIGYTLVNWGGVYSFGGAFQQLWGYAVLPEGFFTLPDGSQLSTFGVLLSVALPIAVAGVGFLGPEIVKKSRVTRAGFTAFGAFILALSVLLLISMLTEGLSLLPIVLGIILFPVGTVMVLYGLRPKMLLFSD